MLHTPENLNAGHRAASARMATGVAAAMLLLAFAVALSAGPCEAPRLDERRNDAPRESTMRWLQHAAARAAREMLGGAGQSAVASAAESRTERRGGSADGRVAAPGAWRPNTDGAPTERLNLPPPALA